MNRMPSKAGGKTTARLQRKGEKKIFTAREIRLCVDVEVSKKMQYNVNNSPTAQLCYLAQRDSACNTKIRLVGNSLMTHSPLLPPDIITACTPEDCCEN